MSDQKKRCVIADDVRASRMILQAWMQEFDFQCTLVPDGQAADEVLKGEGADLVITDIEMPKMSGLQLLYSVRNDDSVELSGVPVIVISSLQDEQIDAVVEELGGTGFVGKPLDKEVLRLAVKKIEQGCQNLREIAFRRSDDTQQRRVSPTLRRLADEAREIEQ